jgi:hypothetical protein
MKIEKWHEHIPIEYLKERTQHSKKLVCGIGINDADYQVAVVEPRTMHSKTKIIWRCKIYDTWASMLKRAYSKSLHARQQTYEGVTVCEEWRTFSNFAKWMCRQDWKDKQLDKDILFEGNKIYSPETCVFVTQQLNCFLTDSGTIRGRYMIGCDWNKRVGKYRARVNDGQGAAIHLGYFNSELEAHLAWKTAKHNIAVEYSKEQTDLRLKEALLTRFKD